MNSTIGHAVSVIILIAATILGLVNGDFMIVVVSVIPAVLTAALSFRSVKTPMRCDVLLILSVLIFISAVLVMYPLEYNGMSRNIWAYMVGTVMAVMSFSAAAITMRSFSIFGNSSFNWVLIGSFLPFFSLGIYVLGWASLSFLDAADLDSGAILQVEMVEGMMTVLVLSIIGGLILSRIAKRKHIVLSAEYFEVSE